MAGSQFSQSFASRLAPSTRTPPRGPLRLAASQHHQLRVPATLLSLSPSRLRRFRSFSLSLSPFSVSRAGNMTDGHGRSTIGHRTTGCAARDATVVRCVALRCAVLPRVALRALHSDSTRLGVRARGIDDERETNSAIQFRSKKPLRAPRLLRVSTDSDSPDCAVCLPPSPLPAPSPPSFYPLAPPLRLFTHNTTQAAPEAGNETYVGHYFRSGQSERPARLPPAGQFRKSTTKRATFKYGFRIVSRERFIRDFCWTTHCHPTFTSLSC